MNERERILAALDGQQPDRVPLALSFFDVDGAALAPTGPWHPDLVDVGFVAFPISAEEEKLDRIAMPHAGDIRIGSLSQVARYRATSSSTSRATYSLSRTASTPLPRTA